MNTTSLSYFTDVSQSRIGKGGRTMVYRNRKPEKPVHTSFTENRQVGIKKIGEF
jgi:hypothetical protein